MKTGILVLTVLLSLAAAAHHAAAQVSGFNAYGGNSYSGIQGGGAGGWPAAGFDSRGFIAGTFGEGYGSANTPLATPSYGALGSSAPWRPDVNGFRFGATLTPGQWSAMGERASVDALTADADAARARGFGDLSGRHYFSPTYLHAQALATQRLYAHRGWFTADKTPAQAWVWKPAAISGADWASAVWRTADWPSLRKWLGWSAPGVNYRYGDNVIFQNGNVYLDGDRFGGTEADYYRQAVTLAGTTAKVSDSPGDWLPLGIFAIVARDQTQPALTVQLAIDKQGHLRGNAIQQDPAKMLSVTGAVDARSQRAAWTVGPQPEVVYETGLYNLVQGEAPALAHHGSDRAELLLLVRLTAQADANHD
jgi:hypothetical protein